MKDGRTRSGDHVSSALNEATTKSQSCCPPDSRGSEERKNIDERETYPATQLLPMINDQPGPFLPLLEIDRLPIRRPVDHLPKERLGPDDVLLTRERDLGHELVQLGRPERGVLEVAFRVAVDGGRAGRGVVLRGGRWRLFGKDGP